jgi:3-hydroxy-9,10-secoandrosta-1,3,5(10)-triene-9,17-dione monooxygenase reductase component
MSSDRSGVSGDLFRRAAGRFATGITIATVVDPEGAPHGLTVNSFTSVSLEPPLVLVCIAHAAVTVESFRTAKYFGINILASDQRELSDHFARKGYNRFANLEWSPGHTGVPLLPGVLAAMECEVYSTVRAGDHDIFLGEVMRVEIQEKQPLLYWASGYRTLQE